MAKLHVCCQSSLLEILPSKTSFIYKAYFRLMGFFSAELWSCFFMRCRNEKVRIIFCIFYMNYIYMQSYIYMCPIYEHIMFSFNGSSLVHTAIRLYIDCQIENMMRRRWDARFLIITRIQISRKEIINFLLDQWIFLFCCLK